jgi:hypothetical protein
MFPSVMISKVGDQGTFAKNLNKFCEVLDAGRLIIMHAAPIMPYAIVEADQLLDQYPGGNAVDTERLEDAPNIAQQRHAWVFVWPISTQCYRRCPCRFAISEAVGNA